MKWNEVDVSFDLPWAVFTSSIQAPFISRFVASFTPAGAVRGTAAGRSAGGAKTTKGTWGPRGPRTPKGTAGTYGAGKVWDLCGFDKLDIFWRNMFWGLAESSRFQMNVDCFHSLILGWFLCSPLGAQMSKRISDIWVTQDVNACGWDMTAQKTIQDRFFRLTYCSLETRNHPNP